MENLKYIIMKLFWNQKKEVGSDQLNRKSSVLARFKTLLILPGVLGLILTFACTKSENEVLTDNQNAEKSEILKSEAAGETAEEECFFIVEEMPGFQGQSPEEFKSYLSENLRYPEIAAENGISGKVFVKFAVNSKGKVVDVVILRGVDPSLDKEAIRVVKSSPMWTPGKQRGKEVKVQFTFPVYFVLD
jgi:protein TonB